MVLRECQTDVRFSHENISELLGIPCKSFVEIYTDKISDIQRSLHDYIKTFKAGVQGRSSTSTSTSVTNINLDPNGYPLAPPPGSLDKITKLDLEKLYRTYITQHYCCKFIKYSKPMSYLNLI